MVRRVVVVLVFGLPLFSGRKEMWERRAGKGHERDYHATSAKPLSRSNLDDHGNNLTEGAFSNEVENWEQYTGIDSLCAQLTSD